MCPAQSRACEYTCKDHPQQVWIPRSSGHWAERGAMAQSTHAVTHAEPLAQTQTQVQQGRCPRLASTDVMQGGWGGLQVGSAGSNTACLSVCRLHATHCMSCCAERHRPPPRAALRATATGTELPAGVTPTRSWTTTDDSQGPSRGPSGPMRGCKGPLRTPLGWLTGRGRASARRSRPRPRPASDQLPT